jgi:hypothetical protein
MLETDLQAWRQQIHELFREARMELKSIMSELDAMVLLEPTAHRDRAAAIAMNSPDIMQHEPLDVPAASTKGSDFSLRLDYLKRKLNERLQERSPADSNNSDSSNEFVEPVDRTRAEKP